MTRKTLSIWWRHIWLHPAVISVMMTFVISVLLLVTPCITSLNTLQEMCEMANVWRGPPVLEAPPEACLLHLKMMVLLHTTKPTLLLHPLKSHPRPEVASPQWNLMVEKTRGQTKRSARCIHRRRLHMKPQARPFTAWRVANTTVAMLEIWCAAASATSGIMRTASELALVRPPFEPTSQWRHQFVVRGTFKKEVALFWACCCPVSLFSGVSP